MKNQAQLIAYVDRIPGGTFRDLRQLLDGPLDGAFGGVHLLPFFVPIDGADAGFDPIDHTQVDPRLGTWDDVAALAARTEIMADVIVNHVSRHSPQFADYDQRGEGSPYAGMFLTYCRVFPDGASESDLLALHTPRPGLPFTAHETARGDRFSCGPPSRAIKSTSTCRIPKAAVPRPHSPGCTAPASERFGSMQSAYAIKKAGTSCFMIPETFAFIAGLTAQAHALDMEVLVEVHGHYQNQIDVARRVDWVYDFALPPLVLHTLYTRRRRRPEALAPYSPAQRHHRPRHARRHRRPDVDAARGTDGLQGLLTPEEIDTLVKTIHQRSRGESRSASGGAASNVDLVSRSTAPSTTRSAAATTEYLVARAIQCFVPGIPQVYYVGLLAGSNDIDLLAAPVWGATSIATTTRRMKCERH